MENLRFRQIEETYESEFTESFLGEYFETVEEAGDLFNEYLTKKTLYLLFDDNTLVGFFAYFFQYSHYANYLEHICVGTKYQGKGYSKVLLNKYIEISKSQSTKNSIALSSTHQNNNVSQKMHLRFGFKEIGVLKGLHYGVDEIFYAFTL